MLHRESNKNFKKINDSQALSELVHGIPLKCIPKHIAIIMDGNNRWAKQNRLKSIAGGHKYGIKSVKSVIECCRDYKVETLSLFAFSSENWNRSNLEVNALMHIFLNALKYDVKSLHEHGVKLRIIGDLTAFSSSIRKAIDKAEELTKNNCKTTLIIAANYGGKWDILQACKKIANKVDQGLMKPEQINEKIIENHLSTSNIPEPDLLIRTSGEYRISNFMLWQCAYTEYYFTNTLWPDFDKKEFHNAIMAYAARNRRFGIRTKINK